MLIMISTPLLMYLRYGLLRLRLRRRGLRLLGAEVRRLLPRNCRSLFVGEQDCRQLLDFVIILSARSAVHDLLEQLGMPCCLRPQ